MEESVVKARIVDRMSLLEYHMAGRIAHNLPDVTSAMEVLYREVLNMTRGWDLQSANFPFHNAAAIDLHDRSRRIAVQVSANCTTHKIVETQEAFVRANLTTQYDKLIFVGIKAAKKTQRLERWAEVYKQSQILNLENLSLEELWGLDERLDQSLKWHRFTQQSDRHCFEVVLSVVDRDAIRHRTHVEGNFDDMLAALTQIKQIATEGSIRGTRIQAKPASLYGTEYVDILADIETHVGRMSSLVKRNMRAQNLLPSEIARQIEDEREQLIHEVNDFCTRNQYSRRIIPWG